MHSSKYTGFAIALAWPNTFCKQAGAWYDNLMNSVGISQNHYYKAGHAATILIDAKNGNCNYFDFGRYHAPFGKGRVRSALTDHELQIQTIAIISGTKIMNFENILSEISSNDSCHGTGDIHASYSRVNFEQALGQANFLQKQGPIPYGPFIYNGTNCSRFVREIILAGKPPFSEYVRLSIPFTISPTPAENVRALNNYVVFETQQPFCESIPDLLPQKYQLA